MATTLHLNKTVEGEGKDVFLLFGAGYRSSLVLCIEGKIYKYAIKNEMWLIRRKLFTECFMYLYYNI